MTTPIQRSQIPLHYEIVGRDGKMNQPWAFWFQQFVSSLPPSGSGYVIDGSASTYGPSTLYQGPDINKGNSPNLGDIYIATDTGKIYVEQAGSWVLELPSFTGDVTSNTNSNVLTLNTVNFAPGTYGNSTNIPSFTVDGKGRVTNVVNTPITAPTPLAEGPNLSVQFNFGNNLSGSGNLTFNPFTNTLTTTNLSIGNITVGGNISFFNPIPTFNNLSPLTTKGDLLGYTGNTNTRLPVGLDGQILVANSAANTGLSWENAGSSNVADTQTPYYIPNAETFTVYDNKQVLYSREITVDGNLIVDGDLIQVNGGQVTNDGMMPYYIPPAEEYIVPLYKQGLYSREITVDGSLIVDGDLIQVNGSQVLSEGLMPYYIPAMDEYIIPINKQGLFVINIEIDGVLTIDGILVGV